MTKMATETKCLGLEFLEIVLKLFCITIPTPDKVAEGETMLDYTKVGPVGKVRVRAPELPHGLFQPSDLLLCVCDLLHHVSPEVEVAVKDYSQVESLCGPLYLTLVETDLRGLIKVVV